MKSILNLLILLIFISCQTAGNIHSKLVQELVKEPFDSVFFKDINEYIYPPHSYGVFMIPITKGDSILLTDIDQLRSVHHYLYKEKEFSNFLYQVFESELDVSSFLHYKHTARISDSIQSLKFEELISQYCTLIDSNSYEINKDYPIDSFYNLVYYLFKCNYLSSCGDYDGFCESTKVEHIIHQMNEIKKENY